MSDGSSFETDFATIVSELWVLPGYREPSVVLGMYSAFLLAIEMGYDDDPGEYDNDMDVRWLIQKLLDSEQLWAYPEFEQFSAAVAERDEILRGLLTPGPVRPPYGGDQDDWWRVRLPLRASGYFREYMTLAWGYIAEDSAGTHHE